MRERLFSQQPVVGTVQVLSSVAKKVVGHATLDMVLQGSVSLEHWLGNTLADIAAAIARNTVEASAAAVNEARKWEAIAFSAALRIACIKSQLGVRRHHSSKS